MTDRLELTAADDMHLHLRDGAVLADLLPHTGARFARAIVMPNLLPPVTSVAAAAAYRRRIMDALAAGADFEPLMTLYLTDGTPTEEIHAAVASGIIHGVKLYPAGATTHSDAGVSHWRRCRATLAAMEQLGVPLLVHGEVTDPDVDIFHRESVFLEEVLAPLLDAHPDLRLVVEHLSTSHGVRFVRRAGPRVAATITAHHLLLNRNDLFRGGLRPHHYCLPVVKGEDDRQALLEAATSGESCFFLGTDSAPHPRSRKEACCAAAGIYTAHAALELYAEAFDSVGRLDRLEDFASRFGAAFYGLPRNRRRLVLERRAEPVPERLPYADGELVPLRAGESLAWRLVAA